jgi:hypothetical protein
MPYSGVKPDVPGSSDGMIDNGFKAYPATRPRSVQAAPGDGSDINIMTYISGPVPSPLDQNPGWQQVNKEIGANLKMNITPFADYFGSKLQVTIAGGELPDLFFIIADPWHYAHPRVLQREGRRPHAVRQRRRGQGVSQPGGNSDPRLEDDRL